jgi:xylan 1,4-beta-xylosidase
MSNFPQGRSSFLLPRICFSVPLSKEASGSSWIARNKKKGRNAMKRFFSHLWIVLCLLALLSAATLSFLPMVSVHAASNTITADFSIGVDNPLLKTKFNLFNTFKRTPADFARDAALLSQLSAETMRVDFELGTSYGQDAHAVGGTANALTYDFSLIDQESHQMLQHGVTPYWDYTYTPFPLQNCNPQGSCPYAQPSSLNGWSSVAQTFANHFKTANIPVATQEVWNEPDGNNFYTGSLSDYEALYAATEAGLRAGDPDAIVGGPTIAYNTSFNASFLAYLNSHGLPLDVDTFHAYGNSGSGVSTVASQLSSYPAFNTTTMSVDEFGSYPCCNYPVGGVQDHYGAAAQLFHDFNKALSIPALASVSWAQFQDECAPGPGCYDPSIGLVSFAGYPKATFNAFRIYSMMPVDRNQVTITGAAQEAIASSDAHRASMVAVNQTGSDQSTTVTLKNVPFSKGTVTVYRIDSTHSSYFDNNADPNLTATEVYQNVNTANWNWTGTIPSNGTVYFQVDDGSGLVENAPNAVGKVVKVNHSYPSRTTTSYADFDPRTWIARQGMGNNQWADQEGGVTAEQLPSVLTFSPTIQGTLTQNDQNSCACIRIDYQVNGSYTKGVLFHGSYNGGIDLYNSARNNSMPFGTKRQADQVVAVPNLAQFSVNLSQYAPSGWSGRAQITFMLQNAGNNTRWVVPVQAGSSSSTPTPTPISTPTSTPTPTPTPISTPTSTPTLTPTPTSVTTGSSCSVHYAITNQWTGGFGASLTITNTGSTAINGWNLQFSFPNGQTITQLWNGSFTQSGSTATITNVSYNGSIPAGQALSAPPGFNGTWNGSNAPPTAFTLNGVACSVV